MALKEKRVMKKQAEMAQVNSSGELNSRRLAGSRPLPKHGEISQLAFRFHESRGWQHGYDVEDWLRAEQELVGQ